MHSHWTLRRTAILVSAAKIWQNVYPAWRWRNFSESALTDFKISVTCCALLCYMENLQHRKILPEHSRRNDRHGNAFSQTKGKKASKNQTHIPPLVQSCQGKEQCVRFLNMQAGMVMYACMYVWWKLMNKGDHMVQYFMQYMKPMGELRFLGFPSSFAAKRTNLTVHISGFMRLTVL